MKKLLFILMSLSVVFVGCGKTEPAKKMTHKSKSIEKSSSCDHLSQDEQEFSDMLSTTHKKIFCSVFTDRQRKHSMSLVTSSQQQKSRGKSAYKAHLTNDQAVEQTLQYYRRKA